MKTDQINLTEVRVDLTDSQLAYAKEIGVGSPSIGIRVALDALRDLQRDKDKKLTERKL